MTPKANSPQRKLFVAKDEHKFSCAHMTLFPDGTKERLHGHNYRVALSLEMPSEEIGFLDFANVKMVLNELCSELREHLLMPADSSSVHVTSRDDTSTEMMVCGKRYVIPTEEVLWLPVSNVVVELLAEYLWQRVFDGLGADLARTGVMTMGVTVTEAPGQGATYEASVGAE